jgi:succinoglycan biosynthesis transport protein ExoP
LGIDELISVLWRRRLTFAAVVGIAFAAVVVTTLAVPKTYEATSTIFVGQSIEGDLATQTLDSTQGEQLARTFTTLASDPQIAELASSRFEKPLSRTETMEVVAVSPVERTQLLEIKAEGSSPGEAADIANVYADVFVRQMGTLHEQGRVPTTVALSARAVPPTEAAQPNVPLYLGFGALLSILLAIAVALGKDRLDRRVRLGQDQDALLGESILARVPSAAATLIVPVDRRPSGERFGDSLRVLRTNVELAPGERAQSLLVTSPSSGEGKTTVARELAMTIANDGDSVALVELDLRRPTLDLGGPGTRVARQDEGMAEVLANRCSLAESIHESAELPGLAVVYSGTLAANPARLLRSERLDEVFAELRAQYEWVIVDSPPLLVADDVLQLTHHVDGCLVVVDAKSTALPAIRTAIGRLRKVGARILGFVVNRAEPEPSPYYGSRDYSDGDQPAGERAARGRPAGARRRRQRARS